jgi:hypothetical protein
VVWLWFLNARSWRAELAVRITAVEMVLAVDEKIVATAASLSTLRVDGNGVAIISTHKARLLTCRQAAAL